MSLKPAVAKKLSRHRSTKKTSQERASRHSSPVPASAPAVIDVVKDQAEGLWVHYGIPPKSCWISVSELQINEKAVLAQIAPVATILTDQSRKAFKKQIEDAAQEGSRTALVASHPGWTGPCFVFGDGTVCRSSTDASEVIVAFRANPKFVPQGTLAEWQEVVGCIATAQPLPLFVMAYALVGPLLRFAPAHIGNPQVVLVGKRESGKSTLAVLAASVWAGDPNSNVGGGETWDLTVNMLDILKLAHSDILLVLDEMNLAGLTRKDQSEVLGKSIFKASATGRRQRATDTGLVQPVKLALLSTSNLPLQAMINAPPEVADAQASRVLSITIPRRRTGALASVPSSFADTRQAMECVHDAVALRYGTAGRAFVEHLTRAAETDEAALRKSIQRRFDYFLRVLSSRTKPVTTVRTEKTMAITYVALRLAQEWGILPRAWKGSLKAMLKIWTVSISRTVENKPVSALKCVRAYIRKVRPQLLELEALDAPLPLGTFRKSAGFWRSTESHRELLIPAETFRRAFPDNKTLMQQLRRAGLAQTECGRQPKLTIKAPSRLCSGGRVYCIRLPSKRPRRSRRRPLTHSGS